MYRLSATNEIVYTPEDLVLFRESPFASWMERLTLENPEHGIQPDTLPVTGNRSGARGAAGRARSASLHWQEFVDGVAIAEPPVRKATADVVALLESEGKDVVMVDRHASENERRKQTTGAMRAGPQYIAGAQLAVGPLSCRVDLLIRCDGVSELGNYLYVPAATQPQSAPHTSHTLCFAADLLKSLQGVEPPELLVLSPGQDITCLPARDHMPRYNELKYAFMSAQLGFRKHRVPDPAASSHHGRWSNCARELMAKRASAREIQSAAELAAHAQADGTDQAVQHDKFSAQAQGGLAQAMTRAIASLAISDPASDRHKHMMAVDEDAVPAIRRQGRSG